MMVRLVLPVLACALMVPTLSQADSSSSTNAEKVARWIAQLGSKKFAEREAAASALDSLGESALKALREARASADLEVSRRADEVFARIERRLETARLLAPRKVRLVYQETRVLDALNDAASKLQVPLEFEGDRVKLGQRTITLDTGDVSPWEALAKFERAAGLVERAPLQTGAKQQNKVIEIQNGAVIQGRMIITSGYQDPRSAYDTRIILAEDKRQSSPMHDAGAVRIRAVPASGQMSSRAVLEELARYQNAVPTNDVQVNLEVIHQPHLAWHGLLEARVERAVDEHGQELKQPPVETNFAATNTAWARNGAVFVGDLDYALGTSYGRQWPIRLKPGPKPSKTLRELSGTISAQVEVGPEPLVTIDNVFQVGSRTHSAADGTMLKVLSATRAESGQIQVRVEVLTPTMIMVGGGPVRVGRRAAQAAPLFQGSDGSGMPLALLDRSGKPVPLLGTTVPQQALGFGIPQEIVLLFEPKAGQADAAKLVYSGKRMVVLEIPFSLKDVPLP